ncbi:HD domain-containing protein [Nonomuraea jiangxiensis]|uniref:HD domain-containing protein n=1 Tax=Nonomuraea jiangxiensis TaxID=633440 RepID=A0A1G9C3C6_9ACTN|nr:HD domain-containing protein [Nonomuraea jiangxiensis]SDK46126.1 HD domain-containing protein [Nonomuraea jiangxiensis]
MTEGIGVTGSHLDPLLRALPATLTAHERDLIERAYTVAAYWHRGGRRVSGDPYITHPVAVAVILAELGREPELLCAALLHDVLRDTACSREELAREFGDDISGLVAGLSDLDDPDRRAAGWETSTDERILLLKVVDRLHNQRTMRFLPPDKQRRKSLETLEFVAPVAGRLGMEQVEQELRRLARATLWPHDQAGVRASFRAIAAGAFLLPRRQRHRWLEEWLSDLQDLPDRRSRRRFTAQLLVGMPRLAAELRWPLPDLRGRVARVLLRCLRWVVGSNARAWSLLAPFLLWIIAQAATSSLWEAVVVLMTLPPVLSTGIGLLRARLRDPGEDL